MDCEDGEKEAALWVIWEGGCLGGHLGVRGPVLQLVTRLDSVLLRIATVTADWKTEV